MARRQVLGCIRCEKTYQIETQIYFCTCGHLLEVRRPFHHLKKNDLFYWNEGIHNPLPDHPLGLRSGVWKYHEVLPKISGAHIVSWNEGHTRCYQFPALEKYFPFGLDQIYWKHEGENPTGSF